MKRYRNSAASLLQNGGIAGREPLDLLAAFASDACFEEREHRVTATPFCFITGSGHQYFLDTVRQLMKEVTAGRVQSALFEPWTYSDEKLSLRWDPIEDRRYALMDRDPARGNKGRTVWMANLLAYQALALFPSAPGKRGLETTGWSGPGDSFTWPVWGHPAGPDTIRSLMLLSDLVARSPDRAVLRARGVVAILRSRRIKVGSGADFKINFSPVRGV